MGLGAVILKASESVLARWLGKPDRLSAEGQKIREELRAEVDRLQKQVAELRQYNGALSDKNRELLVQIGTQTVRIIELESEIAKLRASETRSASAVSERDARIVELESSLGVVTRERDRLIRGLTTHGESTLPTGERAALPKPK